MAINRTQNIKEQFRDFALNIDASEQSLFQQFQNDTIRDDNINELVLKHCLSQRATAEALGMIESTFRQKVEIAIKEGIIEPVLLKGKTKMYSRTHLYMLAHWLGVPCFKDRNWECIVAAISNLKGGVGKSTTCISLASKIALDENLRARVLVIEVDPQGSQGNIAISPDETALDSISAIDIMLGYALEHGFYHGGASRSPFQDANIYKEYRDAGHSHDDIISMAIRNTHIDGLDVIPALPSDSRAVVETWINYALSNNFEFLSAFEKGVIDHLKSQYDFIFIDTPPDLNPITLAAINAANVLITPIAPKKLDWISTKNYYDSLYYLLEELPNKGDNIRFTKAVIVNYDDEHGRDTLLMRHIKTTLGEGCMNSVIKRSQGFEVAARHYRTIYDLKSSDIPKRQRDKLESVGDVVRELLMGLEMIDWTKESADESV